MASGNLVRIDGSVEWKVWQTDSGEWVGVCDALGVTLQSETWAEMMEDISDGLELIFKDLIEENEFERFLSDRGWVARGTWDADSKVDLPFIPALVGAHG